MLSDRCLFCLSVCLSVMLVYRGQTVGWILGDSWHAGWPQPWPHSVRWGPSSPPPKGHSAPQFLAHICCGQVAGWIKLQLGREVGLGPSDIVLDRAQPPSPEPQFFVHVYVTKRLDG